MRSSVVDGFVDGAQDLLLPFPLRIAVGQNIDLSLVSAITQLLQAKSKPSLAHRFAIDI